MINLSNDDFRTVIAEARLAPSVHNIQPSRWRLRDGTVELLGDRSRSIPVADPAWRDWRISHGTAFEGLVIALARKGLSTDPQRPTSNTLTNSNNQLEPIVSATLRPAQLTVSDHPVTARTSWRGGFKAIDHDTNARLDALSERHTDLHLIRKHELIDNTAKLADTAGFHFISESEHRRELLHWMRLSRSHPDFNRDGLNAIAMNLSGLEAWGAKLVLGPLFNGLNKFNLAAPLTNEYPKARTAAAFALFHRPIDEDAFESGRAFYRAWLAMEDVGLKGCPVSVLSDWPPSRDALHQRSGLHENRAIVSVFRIGLPSGTPSTTHARLPVDELIV